MDQPGQFVSGQGRKILLVAGGIFAVAGVISALVGDWLLAGVSAVVGLAVWSMSWPVGRDRSSKVILTAVWVLLGGLAIVFQPLAASVRQTTFFIGFLVCLGLNIVLVWFRPKQRTQWQIVCEQCLFAVAMACYWMARD